MSSLVTPTRFRREGDAIIVREDSRRGPASMRRFRATFGTTPFCCLTLWKRVEIPEGSQPKHLLWAMMLLKTYAVQEVMASLAGVDEKTFRKWAWVFIEAIAVIEVVSSDG